jgi:serine/threonine protein kinase
MLNEKFDVFLIDFGLVKKQGAHCDYYSQTRWYRSPEVILNVCFEKYADMWSVGCILFEMITGMVLFRGGKHADTKMPHNSYAQLYVIVKIIGDIPDKVLCDYKKSEGSHVDIYYNYDIESAVHTLKGITSIVKSDFIKNINGLSHLDKYSTMKFAELIISMLDYNIKTRIGPNNAYSDVFLNND